jgi:transcriptional regulator
MRHNPDFASNDPELVRDLVRANPWAILVTASNGLPTASHYPVVLEEGRPELTLLTHLGRPDDRTLEIEHGEALVIIQGHHGYISPSWYDASEEPVPTWNFTVAHLRGLPEILGEEENLRVLASLVERFESRVSQPTSLDLDEARRVARGTVGLRIPIRSFQLKRKLSQNKSPDNRRRVVAALRESGPYRHPALADEIENEIGANQVSGGSRGRR